MTLQERINIDLKAAITSQNIPIKDLLRVVIGDFSRVGKILTDDQVLKIVKKMSEEAVECNNPGEVSILAKYIPKGVDEESLKEVVQVVIAFHGFTQKDTGEIMKACKVTMGKDFDGKIVSKILKELFV